MQIIFSLFSVALFLFGAGFEKGVVVTRMLHATRQLQRRHQWRSPERRENVSLIEGALMLVELDVKAAHDSVSNSLIGSRLKSQDYNAWHLDESGNVEPSISWTLYVTWCLLP